MNKIARFNELVKRDNTHDGDVERKALFHIIAGNDDLYSKVNYIYYFTEHSIRFS